MVVSPRPIIYRYKTNLLLIYLKAQDKKDHYETRAKKCHIISLSKHVGKLYNPLKAFSSSNIFVSRSHFCYKIKRSNWMIASCLPLPTSKSENQNQTKISN